MSNSVSQKTSEIKSSLSAIGEDLYKKHQKPTWGYESLSKNNDSSKLNEGNYSQADKYREINERNNLLAKENSSDEKAALEASIELSKRRTKNYETSVTELEKINAEFEKQHKLEAQDNYNNIVKERNNSYATYLTNLEKVNKEIDESQKVQKKINDIDASSLEKLGYPTGNEVNYLKELRKEQEAYVSQMEKIKSTPIDNIVETKPTYYEDLKQAETKYLSQMEAIRTSSIDKIKSSEQSLSGYLKQESGGQIALNVASQDNNAIRKQKIGIIEEENGQMVFNISNQEKEISATEAQIAATNALVEAKNKELLANTKEKLLSMNAPGVSKNEDLTVEMLQKISKESDGASKALADLTLKEIGLGEGAKKASIGMKALAMAGNMIAMFAISEVLSLVVAGFDTLIHRVDNAKDALEEFNSSVKEQKDNLSTQESWINENGKRFEELSQGIDEFGHNVSLTTDEFSEYKDMTSKIAEMFPTMIKGYNDQNDVILKNKGSVDELTEAYKKNQEAYYADIRSKSSDTFDDFKTAISDDSKNAKLINNIINGKLKLQGTKGSVMSIDGSPVDTVDLANALGKDTFDKILEDKSVKDSLKINTDTFVDFDSLTPELQDKIRDAFTSCNATVETESEKVKPILDAYFNTNTSGFKDLSEEAQTDAKLFASNVTGEFLDQFDSDIDMEKWIRKNVISPLKDGIDSDDLGGMTANLLGGKTEDESIGDYEKRISTAISDIKAYCKKNKIEIPFNLDAIKSEADEVKATAKSVVKDIEKDVIKNGSGSASDIDTITNWVNSLTQDELKYAQSDEFQKALVAKQQELGRTSLAASEYKDVLELVKKTESDTVDTLGGTLDSVKKAFESDNASTDWTSLAGYLKQAKELYDGGFIGTDDFQSVAQWMSPDKIDTSQYEISANAYVDAWKNAYDKVSRWFDSEDETASIWNFLEDLKTADSSLVDIDKDTGKVQTHFSSTAEVAKALGVNVEVVETMLKTMSDYGFQLDGVEDSAQELEQVKTDLASVQALYDNMQDGSRKDRLGELLKNWNTQVDGFQQDMSTMQQGFDIPIKFEYDIQQIYDQIDQIRSKMANGGKESRNDYANLLGLNDQAISKLEDHTGTDDVTNEYLEKYQNAIEKKSKAISKIVEEGGNDEDIIAAQKKLDKKQQEYEKLLQQFNDWSTKNNIDFDNASAEDFQNYWNDFFSQPHELEIDAKVKNKEDIENLLEDASENSTITFTANVDGVEQQITAIKNEDGTITYYGDVSDPETQVYYVKDQDGMIYFSGDTTEAVNNVIQTQQNVENSSSSFTVGADTSPAENSANSLLAAISQGKASVTVDGNLSPFQKAWNKVAGFLNKLGGNVPTFSATHSGGEHSISGSSGKISGNSRASVLANKERALNSQMRGGSSKKNTSPRYVSSRKRNTGAGNLRGNLASPSSRKAGKSGGGSKSPSSGGGSGSGSDSKKEPTKKDYDWIETLISRINRQVSNLGKTVSATYKTWSTRNNALAQELGTVNQQISAEQQAYNKYMQLANSVGLPEGYASLVRNGTIDVSTIQDDDLNDKIEKYQNYYNKALEASDAVQDLQDKLAELAKTKFDNVNSEYEAQLKQIDHSINVYDKMIDTAETQGYIASQKYYNALISTESSNISKLQLQYSSLTSARNEAMKAGNIAKYSEEWYSMTDSINSVEEAIQDANKSLIEYKNNLRQVKWDFFDKQEDYISKLQDESDWLINLITTENKLFNSDNGKITSSGKAVEGLHAINYNAYMTQADDYAKEIKKIDAEIANDPANTTLIERRQELLEQQRDMIKSAEDEKSAIKDLVSDGYDALSKALKKIADNYLDALNAQKDLYDYAKTIREQTKAVAQYEKQLEAIKNDTSEEAKAQIQQIKVKLEDAKQDLADSEYNQWISDQQNIVDTFESDLEDWINSRLDDLDELVQNVIDQTNTSASEINDVIEKEAGDVGYTVSDAISKVMDVDSTNGTNMVNFYDKTFPNEMTTTRNSIDAIKNLLQAMKDAADKKAQEEIKKQQAAQQAISNPASSSSSSSSSSSNSHSSNNSGSSSSSSGWGSWFVHKADSYPKSKLRINSSIVDRLKLHNFDSSNSARAGYYKAMGGSGTYVGSASQNNWMISEMKKHGFKQGGTIGKLIRSTGEDGFVLARTGEEILSNEKLIMLKDALQYIPQNFNIASTSLPKFTQKASNSSVDVKVDFGGITMNGVNNPEEFVTELQKSKRFEKIVQSITVDTAMGKNSLGKYRF